MNLEYELPRHICSDDLCDLIDRMLQYDPNLRITMEQIMEHPWFQVHIPHDIFSINNEPKVSKNKQVNIHADYFCSAEALR